MVLPVLAELEGNGPRLAIAADVFPRATRDVVLVEEVGDVERSAPALFLVADARIKERRGRYTQGVGLVCPGLALITHAGADAQTVKRIARKGIVEPECSGGVRHEVGRIADDGLVEILGDFEISVGL